MPTLEEKARRIAALGAAERHDEEQRQAKDLTDLINDAIADHGEATELPMLNAVFASLMAVEAGLLAMLAPDTRRAVIASQKRSRPVYLAAALKHRPPAVLTVKARADA